MNRIQFFGIVGCFVWFCLSPCVSLVLKQIIGPDSIELGSAEELVLDCDFDTENETEVEVKWFFNGLEDQIYQWIPPGDKAFSYGSLKEFVDPTFKITDDPDTMLRALKLKNISFALTGNYSCKVDGNSTFQFLTKQVIVYSPPESFEMFLIGGDDEDEGNEVILCDANNVSPKPNFNIYIEGMNGSLPETFEPYTRETSNEEGLYNVSIIMHFNSSYLDDPSTKFVCELSIPGTDYKETRRVEYFAGPNGSNCLNSFSVLTLILMLPILLAT